MNRETYECKCGGMLYFNYKVGIGRWECNKCSFTNQHVRVDENNELHENTFKEDYGARYETVSTR